MIQFIVIRDVHNVQAWSYYEWVLFYFVLRSDEDDASGGKYTRMEEDNIQDKERFARLFYSMLINMLTK